MPNFRYRAITPAGEVVIGEVAAPWRGGVLRRVEYLGHLPVDAEIAPGAGLGRGWGLGRSALGPRDVTLFLRQLALLVGAGLTLEAALQNLSGETSRALAKFAASLRSSISAGNSFAEALEGHSSIVESAYV